jgi:hypothetical protein
MHTLLTLPEHLIFCGVRGAWSLVFCVVFCRSLFFFFFWPWCFLSLDLRIPITPLVSSNSSYPSRASELNPGFCGVRGAWSLVFCVVFCRSLFLLFFWPLCILSFDLWILITLWYLNNRQHNDQRKKNKRTTIYKTCI